MKKRLIICLTGGIVAGVICLTLGLLSGSLESFSTFAIAGLFLNRIMLGFTIGISRLKIHYLLHGALIGCFISLISSISFLESKPDNFIAFTTAGIIFGLLIEIFASKVFKAKMAV